jgi:hypothetical protein
MQTHSSVYKKSSGRRNYTLPKQWSLNEIDSELKNFLLDQSLYSLEEYYQVTSNEFYPKYDK